MEVVYPNLFATIIGGVIVAILTGIFAAIIKSFKTLKEINEWKKSEINNIFNSEFSEEVHTIITSPEYIPTMGQKEGPHNNEEIIEPDENRFLLVKTLLEEIFANTPNTGKKRYAILGGSGMGKTTFSASLFYNYIHRFKFKKSPYPIYVKYLGKENVLKEIEDIPKANMGQSIIILDALDENRNALKDLNGLMDSLERLTDRFKYVILTSRTQLFPNQLCEPNRGAIIQNGQTRLLTWERIYISPFSQDETIRYLENKYKIGSTQYRKAIKIMKRTNDLMARPIVLYFINDLLGFADHNSLTMTEIYYKIIDIWLDRECVYLTLSKQDLFTLSKKLSLFIYDIGKNTLSKDEFIEFLNYNGYSSIDEHSFRNRSLINRRNDGSIKFSHKSIWEFFIAVNSIENPSKSFNPEGLEMAVKFFKELYYLYLNGTEFEYVEYYRSHFIVRNNYLDLELINKFNNCRDITSIEDKALDELIYELRIMLLQRFGYQQYSLSQMIKIVKNINGSSISYLLSLLQILKYQNEIVSDLQECFVSNGANQCRNILPTIVDKYNNIINNMTKSTQMMEKSTFNEMPIDKEIIVFPDLFNYSNEFVDSILSGNFISIGFGFNDNEKVYKAINKLNELKESNSIYIYKEGMDIEDHISFIERLPTRPTHIIVKIVLDDTPIFYVVDEKSRSYKKDKIKTCLENMLRIAKSEN